MLNKVMIIGNLGQDPETRYFPDGGAITNVTLATSEKWKDKNSGEKKEHTEWHKVSFSGRLAEIAGEFLRKGSKVYIEGKLFTRKWEDKEGNTRYSTEIKAFTLQMLGGVEQQQQQQPKPKQSQNNDYKQASQGGEMKEGFSDDIPF